MKKIFFILSICIFVFSHEAFAVTDTFTNPEDSHGRSTSPTSNFGAGSSVIADGVAQDPANSLYGEIAGILKWDISSIPNTAAVTSASITINLTNNSSGDYNFLEQTGAWTEGTVTWNDFNFGGTVLGTIPAFASGNTTINLNASGVALVQAWVDGSTPNDGLLVRTGGTNNSIAFDSSESGGSPAVLEVTYTGGAPTLESLQAEIDALKAILAGVTRNGNNIDFDGVNVRIRNGLGATNGNPADPNSETGTNVNGLGNLIVGYNENHKDCTGTFCFLDKLGSHNVVIGHGQSYTSYGGLVAGQDNLISAPYASVSGGFENRATAFFSSVSGGGDNEASDSMASVSGGYGNEASGFRSTVSGGAHRSATDFEDWVAGSLIEDN